jgi:hypothetical protein
MQDVMIRTDRSPAAAKADLVTLEHIERDLTANDNRLAALAQTADQLRAARA